MVFAFQMRAKKRIYQRRWKMKPELILKIVGLTSVGERFEVLGSKFKVQFKAEQFFENWANQFSCCWFGLMFWF
jgi:hypothetical protein